MMPVERLRSVAQRLLAKTLKHQVRWLHHPDNDGDCILYLDKSAVELTYKTHPVEAPDITLVLCDHSTPGYAPIPVAKFTAYDADVRLNRQATDPQDASDSQLLTDLYREATKDAYNWHVVLADVQAALDSPDVIGISQEEFAESVP